MAQKQGQSRLQYGLFATPLEEMIAPDNPVRVVDAFVNVLDLEQLGFKPVAAHRRGASEYAPALLLKIYLYGYLNRIRSSRALDRECQRNVELFWLTDRQTPCYHTISTFRTYKTFDEQGQVLCNHRKALENLFKTFVRFCQGQDWIGGQTLAIDGTKIAAQNSKKRHITADKIQRKLDRVDQRIEEYLDELDSRDIDLDQMEVEDITRLYFEQPQTAGLLEALADMANRQNELESQAALLAQAQQNDPHLTQISLTDPDSRMLPINNEGMMEVAYNVQSVVDDKSHLIVHYDTENRKDVYLLGQVAKAACTALQFTDQSVEVLADKGYHSGKGLHECSEAGITTYVAYPEQSYKDRPKGFRKTDFIFDETADRYTCPNEQALTTTGKWHEKYGRQGHLQYRFKLYRASSGVCLACPYNEHCCSDANRRNRHGRRIERHEYEDVVRQNRERLLQDRSKYKRRQSIVEHPFGTIKRSWGYHYTLLKGKEKVGGEMAIIFTCYNLRRAMSILGVSALLEALKMEFFDIFVRWRSTESVSGRKNITPLWPCVVNITPMNAERLKRA